MKKVVIISTSLRANSNSDAMAKAFGEGAKSAGHEVSLISLAGKKIDFCRGCLACLKLGECVIKDDAIAIAEQVLEADVVVWATPIYYFEMSGQMKTLIDRMNSLYAKDFKFREVYLLSAAADDEEGVDEKAIGGVQGWIDCFKGVELKGTLFCGGVTDPGEIAGNKAIEDAFQMGADLC